MICSRYEKKIYDFRLILDKKESVLLKDTVDAAIKNLTMSKEQQDLMTGLATELNIYLKEGQDK